MRVFVVGDDLSRTALDTIDRFCQGIGGATAILPQQLCGQKSSKR